MPGTPHKISRAAALAALLGAACAGPQHAPDTRLPASWQPSPNHDARKPMLVVLHHTSDDDADRSIRTLTDPARKVSAHYLVTREGRIHQMVREDARAWHAGASRWGGMGDVNSLSIGIELDNNGREPYPEAQIAALLALLADIRERQRIPAANFIGHADVAPRRKADPGALFPWRRLAAAGFGLWCEPQGAGAPDGFDHALGLAALGYDTADLPAAQAAFRLHYAPDENASGFSARERALLACLTALRRTRD